VRNFVGFGHETSTSHVGLAYEKKEMEIFLGRERGSRRVGEGDRGNQDDQSGAEASKEAHGTSKLGWAYYLGRAITTTGKLTVCLRIGLGEFF
jgi:hypothetical protein